MADIGSVDGGNRAQTARFLRTFRRPGDLSFGDTIERNERVEWFRFRTIGNQFNRASFVFAGSADAATVNVFFRPQNAGGIGRRLGQLRLSGDPESFVARPPSSGTFFIQVSRVRPGALSYGIAFSLSSSNARTINSTNRASIGRELFFSGGEKLLEKTSFDGLCL